jgi:hypothetical protein
MEIDECNVLTVYLEYDVEDVWNREVELQIGGKYYKFDGRELKLTDETQIIVLKGCGVPYNNTLDIFDCCIKQDIVLKIGLGI